MKILDQIFNFFNTNQGIAQWLTVVPALLALGFTFWEFVSKRRPFIDIQLLVSPDSKEVGGYTFFAILLNKGNYPAKARIKNTLIIVGDERYPKKKEKDLTFFLFPNSPNKSVEIGSINNIGISKIRAKKYQKNDVKLMIEIESTEFTDVKMKYHNKNEYNVNVNGNSPVISICSETMT